MPEDTRLGTEKARLRTLTVCLRTISERNADTNRRISRFGRAKRARRVRVQGWTRNRFRQLRGRSRELVQHPG